MGYKCGNCPGFESDKRGIVAHMALVHNNKYTEGDPELVALSEEIQKHPKTQELKQLFQGGA